MTTLHTLIQERREAFWKVSPETIEAYESFNEESMRLAYKLALERIKEEVDKEALASETVDNETAFGAVLNRLDTLSAEITGKSE